jgi:hypothetical protein
MSTKQQIRVAIHESGHSFAAYLTYGPYAEPLSSVSIERGQGFQGHIQWNQHFERGTDRDSVEKEIVVLWGGAIAEELLLGNAKGARADLMDAQDLLQTAEWIIKHPGNRLEARAYLEWMRIHTRNLFLTHHGRSVVGQVTRELLQQKHIPYSTAKQLIGRAISRARNPTLDKVRRKQRGRI